MVFALVLVEFLQSIFPPSHPHSPLLISPTFWSYILLFRFSVRYLGGNMCQSVCQSIPSHLIPSTHHPSSIKKKFLYKIVDLGFFFCHLIMNFFFPEKKKEILSLPPGSVGVWGLMQDGWGCWGWDYLGFWGWGLGGLGHWQASKALP